MKSIYFYLLCCLFLTSTWSTAQYRSKPFRGSFGITGGYSVLEISDFQHWLTNNGRTLTSSNFINLGMEGFIVRQQAVVGFQYQYEGPASIGYQYGKTSPKNDKVGFFVGYDAMKDNDNKHVLITLGLGYCETSVRFHSNPPLVLQDYFTLPPQYQTRLKQANFYINPKILLLYVRKVKLGVEAGATFYFFGNYKYGYDYTYYTYGYNSNGTYSRQSHTQFIGYRVNGVPTFGQASLNISAFIGL